jgi:hypothetical protein
VTAVAVQFGPDARVEFHAAPNYKLSLRPFEAVSSISFSHVE